MKRTAQPQKRTWAVPRPPRGYLLFLWLFVSATTHAQNLSFRFSKVPMEAVFREIEKTTDYRFVYTKEMLDQTRPVTVNLHQATMEETLQQIFSAQPLRYKLDGKYVMVQRLENAAIINQATTLIDVQGLVIGAEQAPLSGATIVAKKSGKMTTSNNDGTFFLNAVGKDDWLVISSIGYTTAEVPLEGRTSVKVAMKLAVTTLDEAIVIAYGTTTKRLSTGSVSKISAEEISRQPVMNPLAAMAGRTPGMIVTQSSGVPGAAFKVQVRGQSSLTQGSEPLFIIDGVPFAPNNNNLNQFSSAAASYAGQGISPFYSINPADIESVEVLKDADATAIYGSRGAAGVVLITTKKGKAGKPKLTITAQSGWSKITRSMDWLNTQQYMAMRKEAFAHDSLVPTITSAPDLLVWDTTRYTDFKKLLIGGAAYATQLQASLSGGNEQTQFLLSGGYNRETTVYPGDLPSQRSSLHSSIAHQSLNQAFRVSLTASYTSTRGKSNVSDLTGLLILPPNLPALYDSTGALNWESGGVYFDNPLSYLLMQYNSTADNLLANLNMQLEISDGLYFKVSSGYNTLSFNETWLAPKTAQNPAYAPTGFAQIGNRLMKSWILDPHLEFRKQKGQAQWQLLGGASWQQVSSSALSTSAYGYTNDAQLGSLDGAASLSAKNSEQHYRYAALFGRIGYHLKSRYLLNLSGRWDGSSRFGPNRQFAAFGAVGAAWIFSKETWLQKRAPFLSFGKLRTSYGITGNDQIGDYQYLDSWRNSVFPYQETASLSPARLFNPDYSWELNRKLEMALELGFWKDRFLLTANFFRNRSGNQLIRYALPAQAGFSSVMQNFEATIQNQGWEISINTANVEKPNFQWNTAFHFTRPRNQLLSFPGLASSSYASTYEVGQPMNLIRAYDYIGLDPLTGIYQFEDLNKDGQLSLADFKVAGQLSPSFYGGFSNTLRYKNWELTAFAEFRKQKGKNYLSSLLPFTPGRMFNQPTLVLNRWQQPGDNAAFQRYTTATQSSAYKAWNNLVASDAVFSDASFVRLKNVTVAWSLPEQWRHPFRMSQARLYMQAQNLLTLTRYRGGDPESQNLFALPPLRTVTFGAQLHF